MQGLSSDGSQFIERQAVFSREVWLQGLLSSLTLRVLLGIALVIAAQLAIVWYIVNSFQLSNQTLSEQISARITDGYEFQRDQDLSTASEFQWLRESVENVNSRLSRIEGWQSGFQVISENQVNLILSAIDDSPRQYSSVYIDAQDLPEPVFYLVRQAVAGEILATVSAGAGTTKIALRKFADDADVPIVAFDFQNVRPVSEMSVGEVSAWTMSFLQRSPNPPGSFSQYSGLSRAEQFQNIFSFDLVEQKQGNDMTLEEGGVNLVSYSLNEPGVYAIFVFRAE